MIEEHFDACHIFATKHETEAEATDGTAGVLAFSLGRGNYYARYGLIREWMLRQDERSREKERDRDED
jgi:hypothetical protein